LTTASRSSIPAVPWLSRFPEINVRIYVLDARGRSGIWFFSLDTARLAAVLAAGPATADIALLMPAQQGPVRPARPRVQLDAKAVEPFAETARLARALTSGLAVITQLLCAVLGAGDANRGFA
jgi:uncharacterized protein YqjF (DUF2071 family)